MDTPELGWRPGELAKRDAVHVAIIPMIASEDMKPGQRIGVVSEGVAGPQSENYIGIVDPFLNDEVLKGDRFWLCLSPDTVTGMRHCWEHPSFRSEGFFKENGSPSQEDSEAWLRTFIEGADCPDYETVLRAATGRDLPILMSDYYGRAYRLDHEYLHFNGIDAHGEIPPEFWDHIENITGETCRVRPGSFSCSC